MTVQPNYNNECERPSLMAKKDQFYPEEECGVVALAKVDEAATFAYLGIHALQHRGQESAGIASTNQNHLYKYASMGKVADVFSEKKLQELKGNYAIGHNRYSTTGPSLARNAQPLRVESRFGTISIAHNGNLTNYWNLRNKLEKNGSIFLTTSDTEVVFHLIAKSRADNFRDALVEALNVIDGAYSLTVMTKESLFIARDPNGFRPLVMGRKDEGWVFASETCALDIMEANFERDVRPAELIEINDKGFSSIQLQNSCQENLCIFELIYFSRPDSLVFEKSVYDVRYKLGRLLAQESPVEADLVMPVPDSSNVAAIGYAFESGIPYHTGLIRSHYIGRTFIEPSQKIRDFGAKLKYNAISSVVKNKRVIVVDDSIMRGTTQRKIIKMLRRAGAREIHVRISSSPTKFPCYYGIDIPTKRELIASSHTIEEIRKYIKVDSIAYLSEQAMIESAGDNNNYCLACFNGKYPIKFDEENYSFSNQNLLFKEYEVEEKR